MSRQYKAPGSFVFALKSTDNLTMFENPADYLHVFSCDPKDGVRWTQAILLARVRFKLLKKLLKQGFLH